MKTEKLNHGGGTYRSLAIWKIRFSLGGYGNYRKLFSFEIVHYPGTAIHFEIGHGCISYLYN